MHADELACLGYWIIQDSQKKGFFSLKELAPLLEVSFYHLIYLQAFRFEVNPAFGLNSFKKEFRFLLQ